ncbi:MAG: restriction endonuclease subunit S [Chloroflexi bacterium]|nr:restriction endonuclease subunit S [Chloroflexota bacterium]
MRLRFEKQSIPDRWQFDRIGNHLKLNYGKLQSAIRSVDGSIPIYGTGGLIEMGTSALCAGDSIIIGRKGTLDNPLYIDHPFWPVDTAFYTSDFDGSTKWLYNLVQTLGLAYFNEATGVPSLSRETFYGIEIPFPPQPEQVKIAEVLSAVDRVIEQTEALIAKYQRIKAGLMNDLLTHGIDEHGQLRDPATHEFKPSPLGMIPAEWEESHLDAKRRHDKPHIKTGPFGSSLKTRDWVGVGVPVITIGSLGEGEFIQSELLFISKSKAHALATYAVEEGDLVFSRVADVGRSVVVRSSESGWIMSSNMMRISLANSLADPDFLHHSITHERTRRQIRESVNAGGREVANTAILNGLLFAWPSFEEQKRIVNAFAAQDAGIQSENTRLAKLYRLKTGLMQDLLTGKVSVEPLL